MLEDYYVQPSTIDRIRSSRLAPQVESYLEWLQTHGYARLVVYRRRLLLLQFAEFDRRRVAEILLLARLIRSTSYRSGWSSTEPGEHAVR